MATSDRISEPYITAEDEMMQTPAQSMHPGAKTLFTVCPWMQKIPVFGPSCEGYGPKCTLALGLTNFFSKGLANNLLNLSRLGMYRKRFGIDATRYQRLASISKLGFSIKAVFAMVSDSVAFCGYTKRWYCVAFCVMGCAVLMGYGALPAKPESANIAAGLTFLGSFCIANIDILTEGHYSRLMRKVPQSGPALVSFIYWFILGAALIASAIQGPLSDANMPHIGPFVGGGCQLLAIIFFILNWFGERKNRVNRLEDIAMVAQIEREAIAARGEADGEPIKNLHPEEDTGSNGSEARQGDEHHLHDDAIVAAEVASDEEILLEDHALRVCCGGIVELNKEIVTRNWRVFVYSVVMTAAVVAMTVVTILGDSWDLLYTAIAVAVVCCGAAFWALPFVIAKVFVYFYLHMVLYLNISGATDSFFTATVECVPNGPHFNYTFYQTVATIIGNVAGIAAVSLFPYLFANRGYRFTLIFTILIQILASLFDIIMVKRWNIYIGIPDHAMYVLGDAIVYEVCYYFAWMPMVLLISRVCPRGSESMVYALVASSGNLGSSMSATIGSLLMELAWTVQTSTFPCDFSNLPMLLLVGHMLMPLAIIPLSFIFIPNARVCDDIDVNGHVIKAEDKNKAKKDSREVSDTEPTRE